MKKEDKLLYIVLALILFVMNIGIAKFDNSKFANSDKFIYSENKYSQSNRALSLNDIRSSDVTQIEYIGEAYNSVEKNGQIKVHNEKDENSEVIAILSDYEKVELLETLPYGWFKVRLKSGQVGFIDARYIRVDYIPPHEYDENSSKWVIKFSEKEQILRLYNNGELMLESIGSSGLRFSFTPKGVFQIEEDRRGEWAYVPRFNLGMKYWIGFKDSYLIHSVPCTEEGEVIKEEEKKLGKPSSHGCIRVPVDVSKYIYENVPDGSIVIIE